MLVTPIILSQTLRNGIGYVRMKDGMRIAHIT